MPLTVVLLLVFSLAGVAQAERVAQVPLDLEIKAPPRVRLTITPNALIFRDADPDTTPVIAAQGNPVQVTMICRGEQIMLTLRGTDHLVSGADTIEVGNITWSATGAGFLGGRLRVQEEVPVGKWQPTSPIIQGTLAFFLANSWQYAVGTYKTTVIFTASAL